MEGSSKSPSVDTLLDLALELAPQEREAFLTSACAGDEALLKKLRELVTAAESGFLERPVGSYADLLVKQTFGGAHGLPAEHTSKVGKRVDEYEVLERIGVGGMATVYKARDTKLNRLVALKFLTAPIDLLSDAARLRFIQEARVASGLDHPNICTIYEIGDSGDGRHFIAMPFYEGRTLKEIISDGPLPIGTAVGYVRQIARGLERAHEAGIVHRDIKPGNLLVTTDGTVKILDFGLAKIEGISITRTDATPGTAAYMSPEQATGESVDSQTDLWSLGVVLYEMLTGRRPFEGDNSLALLYSIVHDPTPSVDELRLDVSHKLSSVVSRLLQKRKSDRYSSADQLLRELDRMEVLTSPSGRARRRSSSTSAFVLAGLVSGAVFAAIAISVLEKKSAVPNIKKSKVMYWLPPLAPMPTAAGPLDLEADPIVEICPLERLDCQQPMILNAMPSEATSETLDDGEQPRSNFAAEWQIPTPANGHSSYRLRVLEGGQALGFTNVQIDADGGTVLNLDSQQTVNLTDDMIMPIRFRIEQSDCLSSPGLLGYWPGDGHARDASTFTDSRWVGESDFATGKLGQAFRFGEHVEPQFVVADIIHYGAFSLSLWAKSTKTDQGWYASVLSSSDPGNYEQHFQIHSDNNDNYWFEAGHVRGSMIGQIEQRFQHLAVVYDGVSTVKTFLDGRLVKSDPRWNRGDYGSIGLEVLKIGINRDSSRPFTGLVDEVAVFESVLDDSEVHQLYNRGDGRSVCTM